jgi:hypothetical protein
MTAISYAMIVRDAMLTRVKTMPFFTTFKFGTNKSEPIQPERVPFFGIYFINEDLTPDGDANAGEPRFKSSALYGFSIIVQNNDATAAENKLDEAWTLLLDKLFRDPSLYLNPNAMIQAYTRGNRTHQFGSVGADNSIPIAECRFTLTCDLGVVDFPPIVPDDYLKLHVETRYPTADTDPAEVQQVIAEYDILQNKEKDNGESNSKE